MTKLPTPNPVPPPLRQAANNPPYPADSSMPLMDFDEPPSYSNAQSHAPPNGNGSRSRASSTSSHGTWNTDPSEPDREEEGRNEIPESLRPGPKKPGAQQGWTQSAPPFGQSMTNGELQNSAAAWQQSPQGGVSPSLQSQNPYLNFQTSHSPTRQPQPNGGAAYQAPSEELASLMIGGVPNRKPIAAPTYTPPPPPGAAPPAPPAALPPQNTGSQYSMSNYSQASNPWQEDLDRETQQQATTSYAPPPGPPPAQAPPKEKQQQTSYAPPPGPPPFQTPSKEKQPVAVVTPSQPPHLDIAGTSAQAISKPEIETPRTQAKRQRNEVYQIKHVNWYDASAQGGRGVLRRSPILTQNANGPCPIVALVNALSLTTPDSEQTELIQTLRTREQITLGLLLDAVFEELVRRNEMIGNDLPDIGHLYSFLITLHTGMNVNPSFVRESASSPGSFEQTSEMQLYGSFHIPLVHGWTCPYGSETYEAFSRSARTFDEALNMQFLEEEFDAKLRAGGLSREEQQVFEDLTEVKHFLTTFPTQISDHGLDILSSWLQPGQVAILFRNDHFCTLYKEPEKGTLMTLVTDAGYFTHDEIVWESLVDVNGALAEFFSGDFRSVGASRQNSSSATDKATSPSKFGPGTRDRRSIGGGDRKRVPSMSNITPTISRSEQEDLDLALALQLQEEEEEASRLATQRREAEHNDQLSRQYIDGQGFETEQRPPQIPPRRSQQQVHTSQTSQSTQVYDSSSRTEDGQAPPPTYEQAANDMPYREAGSTPNPPRQGNALGALSALDAQRQQSAFTAQSGQQGPTMAPTYGRRPSRFSNSSYGPPMQGSYAQGGRYGNANGPDERCNVM